MAAKVPSVKRYVERLSTEERQQLEAMIRKGKSPARRLLKAGTTRADFLVEREGFEPKICIAVLPRVRGGQMVPIAIIATPGGYLTGAKNAMCRRKRRHPQARAMPAPRRVTGSNPLRSAAEQVRFLPAGPRTGVALSGRRRPGLGGALQLCLVPPRRSGAGSAAPADRCRRPSIFQRFHRTGCIPTCSRGCGPTPPACSRHLLPR